jgi:hypothetical protein
VDLIVLARYMQVPMHNPTLPYLPHPPRLPAAPPALLCTPLTAGAPASAAVCRPCSRVLRPPPQAGAPVLGPRT